MKVVDRLRRRMRETTAFVLGGGGNLGALQVGMLRALTEHDIVPDVVLGCSVGAINGAAFSADPTVRGVRRMEALWRRVPEFDIMPSRRIPPAVNLGRRGGAIFENDGLRRMLEAGLPVDRFEQLALPFQCVAAEVDTARERWFTTGPLIEPVLASAALPTIYPMVTIDGRRYLDGGLVDDIPISRAVALGCRQIFVLHIGHNEEIPPDPRRPYEVGLIAFWVARRNRLTRDLADLPLDTRCTVLPSGGRPAIRFDDFSASDQLIEQAYVAASEHLNGEDDGRDEDLLVRLLPSLAEKSSKRRR
ncbi:MAG: patatin-like phospholipase family protein [Actinomycetota bacterium]|nr:patatin-like phospholipase family protein [Actinomycetota bacterium]